MEQNYLTRAARYLAAQRKQKRWHKVVSSLGAAVVFCTVYALILPAITLTAPIVCGMEEHVHDESCYVSVEPEAGASFLSSMTAEEFEPGILQLCGMETVYAGLEEYEHVPFILHVHDENCYLNGEFVCTLPEIKIHVHDDTCYVQERILICGLEEELAIPDEKVPAGHVHTEDCYIETVTCGLEESDGVEGHHHDESCYSEETVQGELLCGEEEHVHDENCYGEVKIPVLTCGEQECESIEGHTHMRSYCYERELICGLEETIEWEEEEIVDGHVHTEDCYILGDYVLDCGDQRIPYEHTDDCYDEYGNLICEKLVVREHVHTPECFLVIAQPEPEPDFGTEPEKILICEMPEHTHEDACYGAAEPEVPEDPENPGDPEEASRQEEQWKLFFWSNVISGYSDVVLDARADGSWMDTETMDPEELLALHEAGETDLTRYLNRCGIWVDTHAYDSAIHGPMDPSREFNIVLTWSMNSLNFSSMTYSYQFPQQINVEDVEKRVLTDADGEPVMAYSVWNNVLTVTYYAPAADVTTEFSLRASWSGDLGADTEIWWSRSDSTYVTFAEPELTVEKSMGADGLRVDEDGAVWADYTVVVANSGTVSAAGITLTDVLEANYFHFAQGVYEDGADYTVTVGGRDSYESFLDYDGGDTVTFPVFDLEPGESRTFQYRAVMSAADRARVDAAVKASGDPAQAAETVRNTATAVCPAFSGDLEFTSSARATYGGPESKHVENYTYTYLAGAFDVSFTVNGDAQLPVGMTQEKLEQTTGEGLQLTVEALDEDDQEYQAFVQQVEETESEETGSLEENLVDLQVLRVGMNYNGVELNLDDCDVQAVVTPSQALQNYQPPRVVNYSLTDEEKEAAEAAKPLGDEGYGISWRAFSLDKETVADGRTQFVEAASGYLDKGEDALSNEWAAPVESAVIQMMSDTVVLDARMREYSEYNVEFWANVQQVFVGTKAKAEEKIAAKNLTGATTLEIVDTSGGNLPRNGKTDGKLNYNTSYLILQKDGSIYSDKTPVPLFAPKLLKFNPNRPLTLNEFNVYDQFDKDSPHYKVVSALILYPDKTEEDLNEILENKGGDLSLVELNDYLKPGATVKFVFDTEPGTHTNAAVFYDYDITDGKVYTKREGSVTYKDKKTSDEIVSDNVVLSNPIDRNEMTQYEWEDANDANHFVFADTRQNGINSSGNYTTFGTKFAFGNSNTGTTLAFQKLSQGTNNLLNKYNNNNIRGCTFGIANDTLVNGMFAYAQGIVGPRLFNQPGEKAVTGKTTYADDYSLKFLRVGDTYTLTAVNGVDTKNKFAQDLDRLHALSISENLYSNEFWPMDYCESHGTEGHDLKFGSLPYYHYRVRWDDNDYATDGKHTRLGGKDDDDLPPSDFRRGAVTDFKETEDHNSYFGMQFSVQFTIPEGYVGPLDYCFFGDDDLWLYLTGVSEGTSHKDGKLVCDIGGVHLTTGEYVNLRDYIPVAETTKMADETEVKKLKAGTYRLDLYYTERGASGSTCWMQYTLPGIQSVPVDVPPDDPEYGNLRIQKKVEGVDSEGTAFRFDLRLSRATASYDCEYYDKNGNKINEKSAKVEVGKIPKEDGTLSDENVVATFYLKDGESVLIKNLPVKTYYTITEVNENNKNAYEVRVEVSENGSTPQQPESGTSVYQASTDGNLGGMTYRGYLTTNSAHIVTYTNKFYYALPETGGAGTAGMRWYTMSALPVMAATLLVYKRPRKKGGTHF